MILCLLDCVCFFVCMHFRNTRNSVFNMRVVVYKRPGQPTLVVMLANPGGHTATRHAGQLAMLCKLADNWPIRTDEAVIRLSQYWHVLRPTDNHPHPAIRRAAIEMLLLRSGNRVYAHAMHLAQWCVPFVLESLHQQQQDGVVLHILSSCAQVLVNMCSGGAGALTTEEQRQMRERIQGLADNSAISVLVRSIRCHPNDPRLTSAACEVFSNMCTDVFTKKTNISNRQIMRSPDCLAVVLASMGKYVNDAILQRHACCFLSHILNVEDKRPSFAEDVIIKRVLAAMRTHASNTNVQKQGCLALCVLARNSASACTRLNTTGVQSAIFQAMLTMPHSELPIGIETLQLALASSHVITG